MLLARGSTLQKTDPAARFAWLWLAVYGVLYSAWEPATLCYRMTDIIPLGILLALGLSTLKPLLAALLTSLMLVCTLTTNLMSRIMPMHRADQNLIYQEALTLSKTTAPNSLYIAESSLSWIYLLYFTGRSAWYGHSFEPKRLREEISKQKLTRPVYVQEGASWRPVR
jgi:hypothetical protein